MKVKIQHGSLIKNNVNNTFEGQSSCKRLQTYIHFTDYEADYTQIKFKHSEKDTTSIERVPGQNEGIYRKVVQVILCHWAAGKIGKAA